MKAIAGAVVVTFALAMAGLLFRADVAVTNVAAAPRPFAPAFRGATAGPAALFNLHDGQAFASVALDPLLSHPGEWSQGRNALAYRASRPVLPALVALTSFGSAAIAAWSLLVWSGIGLGVLALGAGMLAVRWGRSAGWLPLLLLIPGVLGQVLFGGLSDALAAGLALAGFALWLDRRDRLAVAVLCVAALSRESALLVPAALLLAGWRAGDARRRLTLLLCPLGAYAAWVAVIAARLHTFPTEPGRGRFALPFVGMAQGMAGWSWVEVACVASVVLLGTAAWVRAPIPEVRWLVGLSALFAATMGSQVWRDWDFTRPLLPVTVVGAALLLGRRCDHQQGQAEARRSATHSMFSAKTSSGRAASKRAAAAASA